MIILQDNNIILTYIIILFFGLSFGSFLNVWIYRTRKNLSIVFARSICTHCHSQLSWYENIPVLSFLYLKGKCKSCKKNISLQYPLVEFVTTLLFLFTFWFHSGQVNPELIRDCFVILVLFFIFIYDFKYQIIPDRVVLPASLILFIFTAIFGWHSWRSVLIASFVGAGFFLFQYIVSKGKWIGGGDIRLGLFMGIILGFPIIICALFLAYVMGAVISIFLLLTKKIDRKSLVPFGIYLTFSTVICMFYGNIIVNWYISLVGF